MKNYRLNRTDRIILNDLRKDYLSEISKPIDDYWEIGIVETSEFYVISDECESAIGYVVINSNEVIVQFYLIDDFKIHGNLLLKFVINELSIKKIWLPTYYKYSFMLACDITNVHKVTDYIFRLSNFVDRNDIAYPIITNTLAEKTDLELLVDFYDKNIPDSNREWLYNYCSKWIDNDGIFLFYANDNLIGAGEIRHEDFADEFAFLGIAVAEEYRRQGFGTYITSKMRDIALDRKLHPICSVDLKNEPSLKMVQSSGFFQYDRIIIFDV